MSRGSQNSTEYLIMIEQPTLRIHFGPHVKDDTVQNSRNTVTITV